MGVWFNSLISTVIVSLISLVGVITLLIKKNFLDKVLILMVSFSAGALFAGAFIHLLPHAVSEHGFTINVSLFLMSGILFFFILEKFVHWRHCHIPTSKKHPHHLAVMNIIGDGFHNFIDGMVIGGAYLVDFSVGVATTLAVIAHEIPQEIGDFGVLIYAGLSKMRALLFNFISACTSVTGVVLALIIGSRIENFHLFLLPFTAGGFIYVAGTDLIPEMHKESKPLKSLLQFVSFILGIAIMLLLTVLE
ncbi:ZIP family metal transporter [Candidatus Woesearchaeota archaeon]|nr:ZIP family metal transporter [Candidatus Woesearchaeota archaeon]